MNAIRAWRIRRIKVHLAGLLAQERCEREMSNKTGTVFPTVIASLAREIGELQELLTLLEAK